MVVGLPPNQRLCFTSLARHKLKENSRRVLKSCLLGFFLLKSFIVRFEPMPVDFEAILVIHAFYFNCTMRKNISNNKWSLPSRTKFTWKQSEPKIIEEDFLSFVKILA